MRTRVQHNSLCQKERHSFRVHRSLFLTEECCAPVMGLLSYWYISFAGLFSKVVNTCDSVERLVLCASVSLCDRENCVAPPWCISSHMCRSLLWISLHIFGLFLTERMMWRTHAAHHDFTHTRCAHDSRQGRQRINSILILSSFRKQYLVFVWFCWWLRSHTSLTLMISLRYFLKNLVAQTYYSFHFPVMGPESTYHSR